MRILIVNSERGVAGGLTAAIDLAEGLSARGHEVRVACHPDSVLRQRLADHSAVTISPVPIRAELNAWRAVQIARVLRTDVPDVILADRRKDVKLSFVANILRPGAALVHRHGAPSPLRDSVSYRAVWSRLDGMIVNSAAMKTLLEQRTPWIRTVPLRVIHNGKDLDRYRPMPELGAAMRAQLGIPPDAFVLAYHGVLQARKNIDGMLLAIRKAQRTERVHGLIVGDGPQARALRSLAEARNINVTFAGMRTDIAEVLSAADIAMHLSAAEGFSNSVIESLACGLPVIASDTPSHGEQIEPDRTGWLVAAEGEDAIATLIERLSVMRDVARAAGTAARSDAVERFGIARMLDRYEAALRESITRRARRRQS